MTRRRLVRSALMATALGLFALASSDIAYSQSAQWSAQFKARDSVVDQLKRQGGEAFVADKGYVLLATYSSQDKVLSIYKLDKDVQGPRRKLALSDPLVKYFKDSSEATLFIQSCGAVFGDDKTCDQYSPLGKTVLIGDALKDPKNAFASQEYHHLLQEIDAVLRATPSPTY